MSNTKKIKVKKKKEKEVADELTLMVRESLGTMGRTMNSAQEKLLVSILRAFMIGGVMTILDLILYVILYRLLKLNPLLANVISFVISLLYGVWGTKNYAASSDKKKEYQRFFLLSFMGLVVTEVLLWIFVSHFGWSPFLWKVLAIILVIVCKSLCKKFFFSKK